MTGPVPCPQKLTVLTFALNSPFLVSLLLGSKLEVFQILWPPSFPSSFSSFSWSSSFFLWSSFSLLLSLDICLPCHSFLNYIFNPLTQILALFKASTVSNESCSALLPPIPQCFPTLSHLCPSRILLHQDLSKEPHLWAYAFRAHSSSISLHTEMAVRRID